MIFFVSNDGTVIKTLPSPVYQGSANANDVYLVAPFASNLSVTVAFKLANGVWTTPYLMTAQGALAAPNGEIVNERTKKNYAVWTFSMPNEITRFYGTVTAQFFFYAADGKTVTATSAVNFTVGRGVPVVPPATPDETVYESILSALSGLRSDLKNGYYAAQSIYAWNSTYVYGANEIVFYPNAGELGVFVKSLVSDNTSPPFDALGELTSDWELVVDFNDLYTYLNYGVQIKKATLTFSRLDANVHVDNENLIIKRSCL